MEREKYYTKDERPLDKLYMDVKRLVEDASFLPETRALVDELTECSFYLFRQTSGDKTIMFDLYKLISGKEESRTMANALMLVEADAETKKKNLDVFRYFMDEYYVEGTGLFDKCRPFIALIHANLIKNNY